MAARSELGRIARLLRCDPTDLKYLTRFDAQELRALRRALGRRLYDDQHHTFERIGRASRLLPQRVLVPATQRLMPPRVSAGVVAAMPAAHAAELARRMSARYIADVTTHLDPAVVDGVVVRLPDDVILAVAAELQDREDYDTMAEIVSALTESQFATVLTSVRDASTLVQVALRVTDPDAVQRLVDVLPEARLTDMVQWARRRARLWPELLSLLGRLPKAQRNRVLAAGRG